MISPADPNLEQPENRRKSGRVPFASVRGFIEYNGTPLPDHSEFLPASGLDLSQTGLAFTTPRWPSSDSIVVTLGDARNPTYATARIVGCLSTSADPDEKQFEVRCEFERWLVRASNS